MVKAMILPDNILGFVVQYLPFCGAIAVFSLNKTAIFLLKTIRFSQKSIKNAQKSVVGNVTKNSDDS